MGDTDMIYDQSPAIMFPYIEFPMESLEFDHSNTFASLCS